MPLPDWDTGTAVTDQPAKSTLPDWDTGIAAGPAPVVKENITTPQEERPGLFKRAVTNLASGIERPIATPILGAINYGAQAANPWGEARAQDQAVMDGSPADDSRDTTGMDMAGSADLANMALTTTYGQVAGTTGGKAEQFLEAKLPMGGMASWLAGKIVGEKTNRQRLEEATKGVDPGLVGVMLRRAYANPNKEQGQLQISLIHELPAYKQAKADTLAKDSGTFRWFQNEWSLPQSQGAGEHVADVAGGLGAFMVQLAATKKLPLEGFLGKYVGDAAAWEIVNQVNKGKTGEGAVQSTFLQVVNQLPAPTAVKMLAEMGFFGTLAASEGADNRDIAIQTLIPAVLKVPGGLKWAAEYKGRLAEAKTESQQIAMLRELATKNHAAQEILNNQESPTPPQAGDAAKQAFELATEKGISLSDAQSRVSQTNLEEQAAKALGNPPEPKPAEPVQTPPQGEIVQGQPAGEAVALSNEAKPNETGKQDWIAYENEPGPYKVWLFAENGDDPSNGEWRTFDNKSQFESWMNSPYAPNVSGRASKEEQTYFRKGELPQGWRSRNYAEGRPEGGISVYPTPEATSMAGLNDKPWLYGKGIRVGTGSDGEPLVIPTGPWNKYVAKDIATAGDVSPSAVAIDQPGAAGEAGKPQEVQSDAILQRVKRIASNVWSGIQGRVLPNLTKANAVNEAVAHASAKDYAKYEVSSMIADAFPDEYKDPKSLARIRDIQNKDQILWGYDDFIKKGVAAAERGDMDTAKEYASLAQDVAKAHDLESYDADVSAASKDPKFAEGMKRYSERVNKVLDGLFNEIRNIDPNTDVEGRGKYFPESRVSLVTKPDAARFGAWEIDDNATIPSESPEIATKADGNGASYRNPDVKRDAFLRRALFTGDYTTDMRAGLMAVFAKRYNEVSKLRLYKALQKNAGAILVKSGEVAPPEAEGKVALPIKMPVTGEDGITRKVEHTLFVDKHHVDEIRNVLGTDRKLVPLPISRFMTNLQILGVADLVTHAHNQLVVIANTQGAEAVWKQVAKKIPAMNTVVGLGEMSSVFAEIHADTPEIRSEIANMAKQGLIRPDYHVSKGGLQKITSAGGKLLQRSDTAGRIILNRAFDTLVKNDSAVDTLANRRNFVNQLGNYNRRLMGPIERAFRDIGLSPFIVAGRAFNRVGVGLVVGSYGYKATSARAAIQARAVNLFGTYVGSAAVTVLANYLITGTPTGRKGTPLGAIDLGGQTDDKGGFAVLDLLQLTGLRRGLRFPGADAAIEAYRSGKGANEIIGAAIGQSVASLSHPWMGPAIPATIEAVTGQRIDLQHGRAYPVAQKVPEGGAMQKLENMRASLADLNPLLYSTVQPIFQHYGLDRKKTNITYGQQMLDSLLKSPKSAIGIKNTAKSNSAGSSPSSRP